jgi:hypothetical protein
LDPFRGNRFGALALSYFLLKHLYLSFVFLNHAVAEMRALSKLIFNFSVFLKLNFQNFHLLLHFCILVNQLFNVLRLILKLTRKLDVLFHCQLGGALELIFVHAKHLDLNISDVHEHFFS